MKSQQVVLVLIVVINSLCLADDNQNNGPLPIWPPDLSSYVQYWQQFQNFILNNNIIRPWSTGLLPTNDNSSACSSPSVTNSSTNNTVPESTTQGRSKVKVHPAARHSHKDVKTKHSHGKKHSGEKHHLHEKHHQHEKHKLKNYHEN
ncbi:dendritic arbor reduction protein 1-like [Zophobas morio]|uniref:dendritic arbor reduction protein 1-like n=1 Tax=Zophobas morio TaxID=2755281 RepID=UPI003083AF2E